MARSAYSPIMASGGEDREAQRRRAAAKEERHYWESREDEEREEEERQAERRASAIGAMETWFFTQFEDPQNETPRDNEEQAFIYVWGGPFDASDVLHGQFGDEYDEGWIEAAVEQIERDGTTEWAPTATGDYYEHPEPAREADGALTAELTARILERLDRLEATVAGLPGLPGNIGHNAPPGEVGLPPYAEEAADITDTIAATRTELAEANPDPARLATLSERFGRWGRKFGHWLAKKGDVAIDEFIKSGVKMATWGGAIALFTDLGHDLLGLARHLLARL